MSDLICFVDLESTGLQDHDPILEIALIATDTELVEIADPITFVVHRDVMSMTMADVVRHMHTKNGLLTDCMVSPHSLDDVYEAVKAWMGATFEGEKPYMAGNSVQFDRRLLHAQMRGVEQMFHYRNFPDVSGFRRAADFWMPQRLASMIPNPAPSVLANHRALPDAVHALETARWFRKTIFLATP